MNLCSISLNLDFKKFFLCSVFPELYFVSSQLFMASTFESIEKEITNRKLQPVYLLKGEEAYYLKLLADKFEKSILDESEADFNLSVFYGKDASMEQIMLTAKQYPLMSPYRVVMLKEAQMMDKRELSKMERYLLKPLPTTVLVIVNNGKDFPQALATKIGKVGNVFDSKKPYDNQVVAWIDSYVKQKGYTIEQQASMLMFEYIGNNLQNISNEISKLLVNLNDRRSITLADVSEHIGISKEYNIFELQNAIAGFNQEKINSIVNYFESNPKENPMALILSSLFNYFVKLLIVSQLPDKSNNAVAQALNISPYFAKDYILPAQRFTMDKIIRNIGLIKDCDLKSKGVDSAAVTNEYEPLKELVYKLIH